MKPEEIMSRLNAITKAELELNWSLGEVSRAITNDSNKHAKHVALARELEEELNKDIREGYVAKVGFLGTLTIYKVEGEGRYSQVSRISSDYSKLLPYGYVMGRKIPKKSYLKTIEMMGGEDNA